jgi:lantibiotic modifying enzyme
MKRLALTLALSLSLAHAAAPPAQAAKQRPYLEAAKSAARWIRSGAVRTPHGKAWPADPRDPKTVSHDLYSGTPGVVLFLVEMHRATGDRSYLADARAGADALLAVLDAEKETGLYTGLAGLGFTLNETFKATGDPRYRDGALKCVRRLKETAKRASAGVEWGEGVTDIIGGAAGTGLFLLYAAREMKDEAARELAIAAGRRLVEVGRAERGGIKWAMEEKFPRLMPNFSHGTAGVAYFLATLYQETRRKEFLDAALAGARYLQAVAKTDGDSCLIFHHEPEGEGLFYLGWCHGPAGTSRLFYRLSQATGDRRWTGWAERLARGVLRSGIPARETPGFWNNVSQCCGSAGVAEYFLSLHRVTRKRAYLDFARRMTDQLLAKATREGDTLKWVQAEHRVRPELLVAQTGYAQGAAGIGLWLLRLDAFERGRRAGLTLPDSPF